MPRYTTHTLSLYFSVGSKVIRNNSAKEEEPGNMADQHDWASFVCHMACSMAETLKKSKFYCLSVEHIYTCTKMWRSVYNVLHTLFPCMLLSL